MGRIGHSRRDRSVAPTVRWDASLWAEALIFAQSPSPPPPITGRGNFGVVLRGHCRGKRVAIKQLFWPPNDSNQQQLCITEFKKEVMILAMVSHPNIVRFLGSVQQKPHFCSLSEYCEGNVGTFLNMCKSQSVDVTWELLFNIALGAARAIQYLHAREPQILHRDIKAENLLLTSDFTVKVRMYGRECVCGWTSGGVGSDCTWKQTRNVDVAQVLR